ncbi:MAG: glycosyltransferase family 2 protein [bacterium]|nr:glycosyltransferase family 2 protein [bacterium]
MKLTVVIPAFNEGKNIGGVIRKIRESIDANIIVVDDGSKDNTYLSAKEADENVVILRHTINLGKGAALKTGCQAALMLGAEVIALMDADGQHSPEDLKKITEKLGKENLDIVFGARGINKKMPVIKWLGNRFLTRISNLFSGISLTDTQSGLKVFKASVYEKIAWRSSDYAVETEIIINAGRNNLTYAEVPIQTIYKDNYKGTNIIDGLKILLNILKQKFL